MKPEAATQYQICTQCVLDTSIPGIVFDEKGECRYCKIHRELDRITPLDESGKLRLERLVKQIKGAGKNKKYDCILGVSGGTDSTYTLYKVIELGLRPLAVHFDNGWDSELAVANIEKACSKLHVDLHTHVVDWEEFKELQISFLKSSTPDAEIPTDVGIHSVLIKMAAKKGINYVINGHSFRTEGVAPIGWTYMDGRYIKSVYKKFSGKKLRSFPNFTLKDLVYYNIIKGIKVIPILNYFNYKKSEIKNLLSKDLDWKDYGGHHHESVYTVFFQTYLLPIKFNIDKRKTELSAMVRSGQISRNEALKELTDKPYVYNPEIVKYTVKKIGLTENEFKGIMSLPRKTFRDYQTYFPLMRFFKIPIKIACYFNVLPELLYYKFLEVT